ncbi:hypothetical protein [Microcoleus sp. F4-D5]|uniref:hypothetical protein n=1 Tax=Microcoleus sp. F4-D5 TaxID=2818760 RepID=UPI00404076BB
MLRVHHLKSFKSSSIVLVSIGLLFLGACSKGDEASAPNSSPAASPVASAPNASSPAAATAKTDHPKQSKGGQVVESGPYHLELLTQKEDTGTHLDLYLQKGDNHEPIPGAKVTAQVQLPNGKQQTLELKYDADGKHYAVVFPVKDPGQYPVKVTADINGEKVDGRFTFDR